MHAERPLRIAMVGPFGMSPKGTMSARALPAARALAARGHVVRVIVPPWHTPETSARAWSDGAVVVDEVSLAGLRVPVAGHLAVAVRMARSAAAVRPDVVHAFKPKAYSSLTSEMLRLVRALGGGPALVQDTDDWEGAGGWNEISSYSAAQRSVFAFQEQWGLRHADHVTSASRELAARTRDLGVEAARVTYLPNSLDQASLERLRVAADERRSRNPAPSQRPGSAHGIDAAAGKQPPVIVLYTRFFEFPVSRPLDVLGGVRAQYPQARLLVVGQGLFGEEADLMAEASHRGLGDAIDLMGWVQPDDLPPILAGADVAIYPFDDTLINRTKSPVKLLELMAAGLPVVAEGVGEPAAVIVDGVCGRLVEPRDLPGFVAGVCELLADRAARMRIGDAASIRVSEHFAWSRTVLDLEAAYAQALASRRAC